MTERHRPSIVVWGSGEGTTFQALADAIIQGVVPDTDIPLVITDRPSAGIVRRVAALNENYGFDTKVEVVNRKCHPGGVRERGQTVEEAERTCELLAAHPDSTLALLGCLRILGPEVAENFGWRPEWAKEPNQGMYRSRIVNTHPGLLPLTKDTYGINTAMRTLERGADETGQTFHVVGTEVDAGPAIAVHKVDVPLYHYHDYEGMKIAATHLSGLVRAIEKAHLPFDLVNFDIRRREFAAQSA
jgi:phosphoribosylglycinamide formyltransferase-1